MIGQIEDRHIQIAKKLAHEAITKYIQQQGLTVNDYYDEKALDQATTSQAVAQRAQEIVEQVKQQKLQKAFRIKTNQSRKQMIALGHWRRDSSSSFGRDCGLVFE